ncbi:YheT family hydrolase [Marixanthomonas spongiae]|uniref:YheT family hydrolase n=1 Tax=Marixanthomonas spongiae TaxID=2174845 RepID=UPI0026C52942|nr:alpha/beta fold hydrolase [Marixanthomonas spongiae]
MPIVPSSYTPKPIFKNGHFATVYSAKLRPVPKIAQYRERILLDDSDFLDVDFSFAENKTSKIAIILHGLEGNAQRRYMRGQAKNLTTNGWDAAAVNFRGCSGEPNELFASYNAGKTDDLQAVVDFILKKGKYDTISLIGFSLGGNLMLKYLGERDIFPKEIDRAVAISTPLNLKGTLESLSNFDNWIYKTSFLHNLKKKLKTKVKQFPEK